MLRMRLTMIMEKVVKAAKVSTEIVLMIIMEKVAKVIEERLRLTMIVEEEAMETEKSVLVKVEETGGHWNFGYRRECNHCQRPRGW